MIKNLPEKALYFSSTRLFLVRIHQGLSLACICPTAWNNEFVLNCRETAHTGDFVAKRNSVLVGDPSVGLVGLRAGIPKLVFPSE